MKRYHTILRRMTLTTLCALLCATAALAQNSIDRKIDHRTANGASNLTAVVKRNPDTRKVEKVVKVLTVGRWEANSFADAFYAEAHKGSFTEKRDEASGSVTLLLTVIFAVLALRGDITGKDFLTIFLTVVTFYFGTQSQKAQDAIDAGERKNGDAE